MELTRGYVESYVELTQPDSSPEQRAERVARLAARLSTGELQGSNVRLQVDERGRVVAALSLEAVGATSYYLHWMRPAANASAAERRRAVTLVAEAAAHARQQGATQLGTRVPDAASFPEYDAALEAAGFRFIERRIEYARQLQDAPEEGPSPFEWRGLGVVPRSTVLAVLEDVLRGEPNASGADDVEQVLADYLSLPERTADADCVHVGFIAEAPAALVIAQLLSHGCGTLTEMGLTSAFRGRGLGTLVQRHGFAMLRAQGATSYRDGTSFDNAAMRRVFERNGCEEVARMAEWRAGP